MNYRSLKSCDSYQEKRLKGEVMSISGALQRALEVAGHHRLAKAVLALLRTELRDGQETAVLAMEIGEIRNNEVAMTVCEDATTLLLNNLKIV